MMLSENAETVMLYNGILKRSYKYIYFFVNLGIDIFRQLLRTVVYEIRGVCSGDEDANCIIVLRMFIGSSYFMYNINFLYKLCKLSVHRTTLIYDC